MLATVTPDWLQPRIAPNWLDRYAVRFDAFCLPSKLSDRDAIARLIGQDRRALLTTVYASTAPPWLRMVPAVDVMRQVWLQPFVTVDVNLRFRAGTELPSASSPHRFASLTASRLTQRRKVRGQR